ncbi:MAG: hypothetical protein CVU99_06490 [Firmicutes bacterium HGW-Firmicutes-4]|nr:MAG: hypothetical protein CVU99_06490 [Firmicutes bacterium HGW-Firmicutes-4]
MVKEKQLLKRKAIMDAVLKLMEEYEFDSLTVRMICDTANISTGTFYHYFADKNALIKEILGEIDNYLEEQAVDKLTDDDEYENLLAYGRIVMRQVASTGHVIARLISGMPLPNTPEDSKKEWERMFFSIPLKIVEKGQTKGQFITEMSASEITDMYLVFIRGVILDWARRSGSYELEEKFSHYSSSFLRFIKK